MRQKNKYNILDGKIIFILVPSKIYVVTIYISVWCPIPSVANGAIIQLFTHFNCNNTHCQLNTVVATRCDPNYILKGYGTLRCAGYEKWSHPPPTCEGKFLCGIFSILPVLIFNRGKFKHDLSTWRAFHQSSGRYSEIAISSKITIFHKRIEDIFTAFVSLG